MSAVPDRVRRLFTLLVGILAVYALIVGLGDVELVEGGRIVLLSFVLISALRVRRRRLGRPITAAVVLVLVSVGAAVIAAAAGAEQVFNLVTATAEGLLVAASIVTLARTLISWRSVDAATVLGVLCIYLLLALLFANLYLMGAAVQPGILNGVDGQPGYGDCLYLSVMTLATVGYGDVTPATEYGRMVAITEAMVGQLYLVSVVAGVVGTWRANPPTHQR